MNKHDLSDTSSRDLILVTAMRAGDEKAFVRLKKLYSGAIYFMILRMVNLKGVAKELSDEAFEKTFLNLHQYHQQFAFSS